MIATQAVTVHVPVDVLLSAHFSSEQIAQELREALAFKLFAEGRLSGGLAAKLAGMPRVLFLLKAGEHGIEWLPFTNDELRRELAEI